MILQTNFQVRRLYLWNFNQQDRFIIRKIIPVIFKVLKFNPKLKAWLAS